MMDSNEMNILAIIPTRGGTEGIPRKNLRLLAGKPLIAHTIERARQTKSISRIVVSTDDPEIAAVSRQYGAEPICRPAEIIDISQVVYVGNDVNDLECLRAVGCGIAVGNAHPRAQAAAKIVLSAPGGQGAIREIAELIEEKLNAEKNSKRHR
jgi:N-acylneuraminate cytidylyltransferase